MFPHYPIFYPRLPDDYDIPPTVHALLNSIVNFDNDNPVKIKDLAKEGRAVFFDFNYPLTDKISKEDFECMILNNYMMRRIGYETLTAFKLALNVKLNSIMPIYNKMFDAIDGWDILRDGESVTRVVSSNETTNDNTTSKLTTDVESDSRYSDAPQNKIQQVQNGTYLSEYTFDKSNNVSNSNTNSDSKRNNNENETINRSPADKINSFKEFQSNIKSVYQMIFDELDDLFYSLV